MGIQQQSVSGFIQSLPGALGNMSSTALEQGSNALVTTGPSKKSAQRRQQRLAKKNFKTVSTVWPMTVLATSGGDIDTSIRLSVHRIIRASAGRYLKLPVIKFRDHLSDDLANLKEDLDRCFIFYSNLKPNYVMSFIEKTMKNVRYVFHKHWVDTGRGQKHEDCLEKDFPKLVKYWKSLEAEQELRELKAEREADR